MNTNGGPARLIRVYGLWIALVTVVVMAAGFGVSMLAPTAYRSAAIVVVEALVRANTTPVPPEMGTEKELAKSGLVVRPAAASLGVDPGNLQDGFSITVAPDANVLTFIYQADSPATAQLRAQALAEAYVDFRNEGEKAKSATANAHATLVTPAYLPGEPVARPILVDLGIGLILGLLLGVGTAVVRDRMSDRIRSLRDFEKISGRTVLATVPRTARPRGPGAALPVLLRSPQSPAAESYRYLRSRLQPLLARDGATSVLVASAYDGEGRSTTAANLATALALAGRSVILVDADLPRPQQHRIFDLPDERGLTDLLAGDIRLEDALQQGPVPRLQLITSGPGADRAIDLLEGPRLAQVLKDLGRLCDVVVIDSPAILSVSDAIGLAAVADHVLLVGDFRRSTRAGVARALAELAEVVDGNVSAVLVNAVKSAGGLVPRPRDAVAARPPAPAPEVEPESGPIVAHGLSLLDSLTDRSGIPVVGSAAVPKSMTPTSPAPSSAAPISPATASTIYQSATSPPAGPVKARANGSTVPAPRDPPGKP
ncbi:AAA family ATPase [Actinoplanes sp. NPDC026619]|uniref:AAA family ATPase n=1 Tax=Actinoplanes sp. NPDC026619 TaxID=3155798 RepID=UPI0033EFF45C